MKLSKGILFILGVLLASVLMAQSPERQADPKYENEINHLAEQVNVKKALDFIKEFDEETIKNQIQLTEIEAPPFKEDKFGRPKLFAELLEAYGADSVWIDSIGNVIGLREGTERRKVLAFAGHLDTVFPEGTDVEARFSGDTIYAPGISDDGRGLTTVLTVLKAITENHIETKNDILFIGNVGEEGLGDLRGMKKLFGVKGPRIDTFISIDGSGINRIVNGGLGSHRYKVTFKGPGGHSWGRFGLANPAHAMGEAISIFVKNADEFTKTGSKTSYNVGLVEGGTSVNSIPFSVSMTVDMRALDPERLATIDHIFQEAVKKGVARQNELRRRGTPLTVAVEMIGNRPSGETKADAPLVQRSVAANARVGQESILTTSSTDSNIPISKGIPAITLGGGGISGGSHSLGEWFLNKEGYRGIQRTLLVVLAEAEISD